MLDLEFKYYIDNQKSLSEKYNGKFIVIIGQSVVGVYEDKATAYFETLKNHKLGSFLIQKCSFDSDSYSTTYHTHRVQFNIPR